jgi:type I restriction enzyme M protein
VHDTLDETKKQRKAAQDALWEAVHARLAELSQTEVKALVIADKWLATVEVRVIAEVQHVAQTLTARVRTLAERYATPLPLLEKEVEALSIRVAEHLKAMGAEWN